MTLYDNGPWGAGVALNDFKAPESSTNPTSHVSAQQVTPRNRNGPSDPSYATFKILKSVVSLIEPHKDKKPETLVICACAVS
jgi:hypothetical protein